MRKLGLALAGGGSLGAYQVGVLKYLLEKGYKFDIITGTSVGAINGALLTTGEFEKLEALWLEISPEKVMVDGININKDIKFDLGDENLLGFISSYMNNRGADITPFKELCAKYIDPSKIKKSKIAFGSICCNFPLLQEQKKMMNELDESLILPFIHASSACFPVFPIETIKGKKYIDGFYKNNLPIDYCFELGAEDIIAIDLGFFSLKPQHHYLTRLPNVLYIKPRVDLGSFMDFSQEVIRKNIARGYLDAKKTFRELRGYRYAFNKCDNLEVYADKFIKKIVEDIGNTSSKNLIQFLFEKMKENNFPLSDKISFLISALEILGTTFEIEDGCIYSHEEFFELIIEKVEKDKKPKGLLESFGKKNKISQMYRKLMNKNDDYEPSKSTLKDEVQNIFYTLYEIYKNKLSLN